MQHILRFAAGDDGSVLLEEPTLAYGLACGYERGAAELGVRVGRQVRMELLDDTGRRLDWRTYLASATGGRFPTPLAPLPALSGQHAKPAGRRASETGGPTRDGCSTTTSRRSVQVLHRWWDSQS
jgi:hypothetical protein